MAYVESRHANKRSSLLQKFVSLYQKVLEDCAFKGWFN
jgi:hypothetical protein